MEKFYIVKPESKLYESYHNWLEDRKKIGAFMGKYLRENNLSEDTKYNIETGRLMVECTEEVKQHL